MPHAQPPLSFGEFTTVYNILSFTIACFLASFAFFILARTSLADHYKTTMVVSALVVGIACYHYFRIFNSFRESYRLEGNTYQPSGLPFNDLYRYVDWLLTVPLLMVELVNVMRIEGRRRASLMTQLVIAAVLMIALGYPGQNAADNGVRALWGTLSTIPFLYILFVLFREIRTTIPQEKPQVGVLLRNTLLLTVFTWGFYPIAYMAPFFGFTGSGSEVFMQIGYSVADIAAKAGYGLLIYNIARLKSQDEFAKAPVGSAPLTAGVPVRA